MDGRRPDEGNPVFREVFRRHYGPLVRRLSLVLGDPWLAEDAVQEAFCRALERWPRLVAARVDLAAWLFVVARNAARDARRRSARWVLGAVASPARDTASLEEGVETDLDVERLARALRRLPPPQREVILLHYYDGCSVDEIARRTGVLAGTVKSRLHRARRALRRLLSWAPGAAARRPREGERHGP